MASDDDEPEIIANSCLPSNKRSAVWAYFTPSSNPSEKDWVACDLCKPLVKSIKTKDSSTSNLRTHLKNHHPAAYSQLLVKTNSSVVSTSHSDNPPTKRKLVTNSDQQTVTDCFLRNTKYDKESRKHKLITEKLTLMLAKLMLPFSLVDQQEFIDFVKVLDPRYAIPGRKYFSNTAIPAKYNETKLQVTKELKEASYLSCTTDGWSSVTTAPYLSLTVHFVTPMWTLRTYCLRTIYMPESHTAEHIASMIRRVLSEYDLCMDKITSFTTDSAANMVKACAELQTVRVPCFGHVLHNAINNSIKERPGVVEMVKNCRQIVTAISASFKWVMILQIASWC